MAWRIEYTRPAERQLDRLDPTIRDRVLLTLNRAIIRNGDPIASSEPLVEAWSGHRRLRVGDWRVIFRVEAERVTVLVVKIGHRSRVY